MTSRRTPRQALDPEKQILQRVNGAILKINDIFLLSGADILFLVRRDGKWLPGYRSRDWNPVLQDIPAHCLQGPENVLTASEHQRVLPSSVQQLTPLHGHNLIADLHNLDYPQIPETDDGPLDQQCISALMQLQNLQTPTQSPRLNSTMDMYPILQAPEIQMASSAEANEVQALSDGTTMPASNRLPDGRDPTRSKKITQKARTKTFERRRLRKRITQEQ